MGNDNVTASPSGHFRTGDGLLNIAANKQEQYEAVCRVVGRDDLITDPRFAERQARLQHRARAQGNSGERARRPSPPRSGGSCSTKPACPPVRSTACRRRWSIRRSAIAAWSPRFENAPGVGRDIRVVRTGVKLNGEAPAVDAPPPTLGQHTDEILASLGYSAADIEATQAGGRGMSEKMQDAEKLTRDWWRTKIIEMKPGVIRYYGYPIEELIGKVSLAQMIWLMTRGELPSKAQGELLDAALMSAVDHGPQAPSIAIARMAATCGVGLNSAMASAVNVLGDVHGGAGEQAVELYEAIAARLDRGEAEADAVQAGLDDFVAAHGKVIPGFGHRFHPIDPRAAPLLALVDAAAAKGEVDGRFARIGRAVEDESFRAQGQAHSDEHRRCDGGDLCRAGFPCAARARALLPVALGRHPRARVGADAAGRPHQGADSAAVDADV